MTDVSTTSYTLRVRSCAEVESIPSIPWFERLRTRKPCQYSINRPASGNKKTAHGKVKNASSSVAEPSTAQRAFPTFPRARLLRMRTLSFLILLTYKCGDLRLASWLRLFIGSRACYSQSQMSGSLECKQVSWLRGGFHAVLPDSTYFAPPNPGLTSWAPHMPSLRDSKSADADSLVDIRESQSPGLPGPGWNNRLTAVQAGSIPSLQGAVAQIQCARQRARLTNGKRISARFMPSLSGL